MDPIECLRLAQEHFDAREFNDALACLADYAQWRLSGGPPHWSLGELESSDGRARRLWDAIYTGRAVAGFQVRDVRPFYFLLPGAWDHCRLASFAWPGGYPLYYLAADNSALCPDCANSEGEPEPAACDVHYEGEPMTCDRCGAEIESAYRPVDTEESTDENR